MGVVSIKRYNKDETVGEIAVDSLIPSLEKQLEEKIIKILLDDPTSEVKRIAEEYLIQCVYEATEDPDKNPILEKIFRNPIIELKSEIQNLRYEIDRLQNEIYKIEDLDLDTKVNNLRVKTDALDFKIENLENKLRESGINIDH